MLLVPCSISTSPTIGLATGPLAGGSSNRHVPILAARVPPTELEDSSARLYMSRRLANAMPHSRRSSRPDSHTPCHPIWFHPRRFIATCLSGILSTEMQRRRWNIDPFDHQLNRVSNPPCRRGKAAWIVGANPHGIGACIPVGAFFDRSGAPPSGRMWPIRRKLNEIPVRGRSPLARTIHGFPCNRGGNSGGTQVG